MKKLTATLMTGLTALTGALTLTANPASATPPPPIKYWNEATAGLAVNGTYRTVVGDFSGGPTDDIVWNSNSSATDHVWTSNGDGTFSTRALPMNPPTGATALVGDFAGDAKEDIFWYGPGSIRDELWTSVDGLFRVEALNVTRTYDTAVLDDATGKDDIVFYESGSGRGSIWSFRASGGYDNRAMFPPAMAKLVVGRFSADGCADIYFYGQSGNDPLWTMDCEGRATATFRQNLRLPSQPIVGQFSVGRDSQDDIVFAAPAGYGSKLLENLDASGRFTVRNANPIYGVTNLKVSNGYGAIHSWDPISGNQRIWFQVPGPYNFEANLSNTSMPATAQPIVGAFVGSGEDILWYQPGSGQERLFWLAG